MIISVAAPGLQTLLQAGARRGCRHLGVPASGAADPLSLALANRLVGNPVDATGLEIALTGPTLGFDAAVTVALTGADAAATLNGEPVAFHRTLDVQPGDELAVGAVESGARVYLAVAGVIEADDMLGSVSTCLAGGFGGYQGRALAAGDHLQVGDTRVVRKPLETPREFRPPITRRWVLRATRSADTHRLVEGQRSVLFDANWRIGQRVDRMGLQLDGPPLDIDTDGRLASAAVFTGTLQCPDNGVPFLLGVDAQTTGGYPRVAQITRADRHLIGQLRPGDQLRLLPRPPAVAVDELRAKHDYWRQWLPGIEGVI